MPGSGAASSDGEPPTQSRTASASVQLNVLLGRKGIISCESSEDTSVRPVVGPHCPRQGSRTTYHPDGTAGTIFLYGSKRRNKEETVVTFTAQDEGLAAGDHRFKNGLIRLSGAAWEPQNIDAQGDTLCGFKHRFSEHSTDLVHITSVPTIGGAGIPPFRPRGDHQNNPFWG